MILYYVTAILVSAIFSYMVSFIPLASWIGGVNKARDVKVK
jgi:hypothetical protein